MTDAQEKKYWRDWGGVVRANAWKMQRGRLDPDAAPAARSVWHAQVWSAAEARAAQEHRSVTADDLRHGCCRVATGRDLTHRKIFQGSACSRLFTLFQLLVDPDNLAAVMRWEDRSQDERTALVVRIRKSAPEGYVRQIASRMGGEAYTDPFWEDLPLPILRGLAGAIREATDDWQNPISGGVGSPSQPAQEPVVTPF